MSAITTHVLDTSRGRPAAGMGVVLERRESNGQWTSIGQGNTDADGRARLDVSSGDYLCEIRKEGFAATPFNVPVSADLSLLIEAGKGETREELEARLSSMENHPWG